MRLRDLLPNLPHEGPPVPRFLLSDNREDTQAAEKAVEKVEKPGCTVADETLTVYGHLYGLSEGWGGFGVLKQSRERLVRASQVASRIGASGLASRLAEVAQDLGDVHSPEDAREMADRMRPMVREAWELGRRCSGLRRLTKEQIKEALARVSV